MRVLTPKDYRLPIHGNRYSAIAVMSMEGVLDVYLAEGTVNGIKFEGFIRSTLLPILNLTGTTSILLW